MSPAMASAMPQGTPSARAMQPRRASLASRAPWQRQLPPEQEATVSARRRNRAVEHAVAEHRRGAEPEAGGGEQLGVAAADPAEREHRESQGERRRGQRDMQPSSLQLSPTKGASTKKPATSTMAMRFGTVMVKRSVAAEKAMAAGKMVMRRMSLSMSAGLSVARSAPWRVLPRSLKAASNSALVRQVSPGASVASARISRC